MAMFNGRLGSKGMFDTAISRLNSSRNQVPQSTSPGFDPSQTLHAKLNQHANSIDDSQFNIDSSSNGSSPANSPSTNPTDTTSSGTNPQANVNPQTNVIPQTDIAMNNSSLGLNQDIFNTDNLFNNDMFDVNNTQQPQMAFNSYLGSNPYKFS